MRDDIGKGNTLLHLFQILSMGQDLGFGDVVLGDVGERHTLLHLFQILSWGQDLGFGDVVLGDLCKRNVLLDQSCDCRCNVSVHFVLFLLFLLELVLSRLDSGLLLGLGLSLSSLLLINLNSDQPILKASCQLIHLTHQFLDPRNIGPLPLPHLLKRRHLGPIRQRQPSKPIPQIHQLPWRNRIQALQQPQQPLINRLDQKIQLLIPLSNLCRILCESKLVTPFPDQFLLGLLNFLPKRLLILLTNQSQSRQANMWVRRVNRMLTESLCTDLSETNILVQEGLESGFDLGERRRKLLLGGFDKTEMLCMTIVLDK
ncbi:MAG: hypothetical protein JOS17DRAFT_761990 [Linnemannia elongata]|nr:MAG: hypothetical protein JOS17DRAFT_761990 [Linnemannia elongata]